MPFQVAAPGFYRMSLVDYVADPAPKPSLSASIAHQLVSRSARHAWHAHPRLNTRWAPDATDGTDFGTIAHAILLENDRAGVVVVDAADWRKKDAQAIRATARLEGKQAILRHQVGVIEEMVAVAREAIERSELGQGLVVEIEQTAVWREGKTWFRIRPDMLSGHRQIVADYKTTAGSAQPDAWARGPLIQFGLDLQAALALRGIHHLASPRTCNFVFVVQETKPPYAVSLIELSPAYLAFAEKRLASAIEQWNYCLSENRWPSYPTSVVTVEPPSWATFAWEMAEALRDDGRPLSEQL